MAQQPQLVIDISPAGSVQIDAQCFTGSSCAKATEHIEIALGGSAPKNTKRKPEFSLPAGVGQKNKLTF